MSWATDWEVHHRVDLGKPPYKHASRPVSVTALRDVLGWVSTQMHHVDGYCARLRTSDACEALGLSRPTVSAALAVLVQRGVLEVVDRAADQAEGLATLYRWAA